MQVNKIKSFIIIIIIFSAEFVIPQHKITIDANVQYQTLEGFGGSDAWNCEYVGKYWSDSEKEAIAKLLFSKATDSLGNPEVNVGTGTLNRERFGGVVERFIRDLRSADYLGRDLDVRENVKFKGGDFSRRIHERYPNSVCVLAIEFKKIFMDEWSGEVDRGALEGLKSCLASTVTGVLEEVRRVKSL